MRWTSSVFLLLFLSSSSFAAAPTGIPRELAQERAELISDLHYSLRFALVLHASTASGHEELTFQLKWPAPLLVDYRGGTASKMQINGGDVPIQAENGHIALPQD